MFGVLTSLVQTAVEQTKKLTEEGFELIKQTGVLDLDERCTDEGRNAMHGGEVTGATATSSELNNEETQEQDVACCVTMQFLTVPPPEWESPVEEWQAITESVLMDENSCVIPPRRITENEELASRLCKCLNVNSIADLPSPGEVGFCEPSEEVIEWLVSSSEKMEFRSSLVPRLVGDGGYWANLSWRFNLYHMCHTTDQLLDLVEIVSTEPNPVDETGTHRKRNIGAPNNSGYWKQLRDKLQSRRDLLRWIQERVDSVTHEIGLARGSLQLLTKHVIKKETTDLGNSVCESCKYHKTKLSRLMGDVEAEQDKLGDSDLSARHKSLFAQLVETNELLRVRIEAYAALSSGNTSEGWETVSNERNVGGLTQTAVDAEKETGDAVFEAALPWEDEEGENPS